MDIEYQIGAAITVSSTDGPMGTLEEVWDAVKSLPEAESTSHTNEFERLQGKLGQLIVDRGLGARRYFPPGSTGPGRDDQHEQPEPRAPEPQPEPEPEPQPQPQPEQRPRAPPRPRASHFLSLRVRSPAVLDAIAAMQAAQCAAEPALAPFAVEPVRLHLTVLVLALPSPEAVRHATAAFRAICSSLIPAHYPDGNCAVDLAGLGTFSERVVFIEVVPSRAKDRLCAFAAAISDAFQHGEHALPPEYLLASKFVPHATVYKLSNSRPSR
jgi:2'-5' RNA ligase